MNLLSLIDEVVKSRSEYQNVELKAAKHGCPERFYDTLSSFSNRDDGGVIIFGIDEKNNYDRCGVYDLQDIQQKLQSNATLCRLRFGLLCLFGAILALKQAPLDVGLLPCECKTDFNCWGVGYLSPGRSKNKVKRIHIVCEGYSSGISALINECVDYNPGYIPDEEIVEEFEALRRQAKEEIAELAASQKEKNPKLLEEVISSLHEYEEINAPLICHRFYCGHKEALEVIERLASLGHIEKNENGRYKVIKPDEGASS